MYTIKDSYDVLNDLKVDFNSFDIEDFTRGLNIETKYHNLGLDVISLIVLRNLREFPNYYNPYYGIEMFHSFLKTK